MPADDSTLPYPLLSLDTAAPIAAGFRGGLHGDDASGAIDIEFPTVHHAASFADTVAPEWSADIRTPDVVTTLHGSVVLTVTDTRPMHPVSPLVEFVKAHALAHYRDGGWDVIVECWTDQEIADQLAASTTEAEALAFFQSIADVHADRQAEADYQGRTAPDDGA